MRDDEAPLASEVARQFGAKHIIVELSAEAVRKSLQSFLAAMDQPTIDGLNTYWVSKAAHETGLKAVLSGLGGDELFGGYASFRTYPWLRRLAPMRTVPGFRQCTWFLSWLIPRRREKVRSLAGALISRASTFHLVRGLFTPAQIRQLVHPDIWQAGSGTNAIVFPAENAIPEDNIGDWREVAVAEQCIYMRNQLLRDADWASMKHSLELRVPLVDRQLSESLAIRVAASPSRGKKLLANSLRQPLPNAVTQRPKTGFALPMRQWIARDIREGRIMLPPRTLLHPNALAVIERLHSATARGERHWSGAWALHCLGSWLQNG
jgi:asparagine synthase (glutamine-hydrolysing)